VAVEEAHRRDVALFRYSLIREAADPGLSKAQRGALVRRLASRDHVGPDGERARVSRTSIDRWIRAWRAGGYEALLPPVRAGVPLTSAPTLDAAVVLKREEPRRTAAQVARILAEAGMEVGERTLQRHFARVGLNRPASATRAFGRFEAAEANERWTGDAMHARFTIAGRKPILFAFLDDHSRAVVGWRWALSEDTLRLEAALRSGLAARGVPASIYVDNGAPFVSAQLARACAVLGIRLIHSRPGQPAGRGKIERFFRTVRDGFEVEAARADIGHIRDLNQLFGAWVERDYHRRAHSETGQAPLERFLASGPPAPPSLAQLHEAFLWSERRVVTKTATVSLHANHYEVDAALVGRTVDLVFDPFDLTDIDVRFGGHSMGRAVPRRIGRHVHPHVRPDEQTVPAEPSGIDYLRLIEASHEALTRSRIAYAALTDNTEEDPCPGQPQTADNAPSKDENR
jgi:putative transposase